MDVKWMEEYVENKLLGKFYCKLCKQDLAKVFYFIPAAYQLLGVYDCKHYKWVFVGDYDLIPPWDVETKEILINSVASVITQHGKYFLLSRDMTDRYL